MNDNRLIEHFLYTLSAEQGSSSHTLQAYQSDLGIIAAELPENVAFRTVEADQLSALIG